MLRAPKAWPFDDLEAWRAWRAHLDHLRVPHVGALKREADHELARIARILDGRWQPKRAGLVPPRPGEGGYRGGK